MIKKIALVRTSSAISEAQAQQIARHITQRYGCEVVYGPECFQSASVQQRAAVLLQYLCDDSIDLLWSVRGGEGSADVLPLLAPELPRVAQHKPKYLLGLSDFTAVLVYLSQQLNWPCLHGPGALQLVIDWLDPSSWQVLEQWVSTETLPQLDLKPLNASACTPQTLTAQCTGGNLSLLNISIGDIWQVETQDKIVCLEDWHEKGYVVERTLKYFQRIGLFDGVKAVNFRGFCVWAFSSRRCTESNAIGIFRQSISAFCSIFTDSSTTDSAHWAWLSKPDSAVYNTNDLAFGRRILPLKPISKQSLICFFECQCKVEMSRL